MGLRFRKSIKMGPVRVNLSKSGVGYSVGGKGFRVTKKAGGGTRTTASIPGTGISYSTSTSGKKTASKSTARAKTTTKTTNASTSTNKNPKGCLTVALWVIGIALVIGLIKDYWWALLIIGALGGAAFLLFRHFGRKKEQPSQSTEAVDAQPTLNEPESPCEIVNETAREISREIINEPLPERPCAIVNEPSSEDVFQARKATAIAQFESELAALPIKEMPVSDPAPRQLLKDLPPYGFSNVTRKTRLDSIFPLVVLDVETTDLRPSYGEIIEVSAIRFEAGMIPVEAITTLCKAKKPIPAEATAINRITDEMVQNCPHFAEIAPAVTEFLKGCHLAGHNLDFDLRFLHASGVQLPVGTRFYDTLDIAHLTVPSSSVWNYKLDTLCNHYGIWRDGAHRALSDCYATAKLFTSLVKDKTDRQLIADPDGE